MKVGLVQMDIAWHQRKVNLAKAEDFARRAKAEGCDLIVFPEMFATGYTMDLTRAEEDGPLIAAFVSDLAKGVNINIVAGVAIKKPGKTMGRNLALVFDRSGRPLAEYTKMRPFSCAGEDRSFDGGTEVAVFPIDGTAFSVFVCYDLRFPELFRKAVPKAKVICVIANWPASRADHWETLLRARAIENQCVMIGVNRTGIDGKGLVYAGGSQVLAPSGRVVCSAGEAETLLCCEIEPSEVDEIRAQFPFLEDLRGFSLQ